MIRLTAGGILLFLAVLIAPAQILAAPEPFGIDVQELDRSAPPPAAKPEKKKAVKEKKHAPEKAPRASAESGYIHYTVQPGDHIFKILVGKLGMSNEAAERLIPEIVRINKISNIKTLQVGSTLLIPKKPHEHAEQTAKKETSRKKREGEQEKASEKASKSEARAANCPPPEKRAAAVAARPAPPAPAPPALPPAPPTTRSKAPSPSPPAPPAPSASQAPGAPVPAPAPVIPSTPVYICSVTEKDTATEVDSLLNALSIGHSSNRIIQSAAGAATAFSIRVDRYFEYKRGRYIVSIGQNDPYTYTLTRLLETAGYRVLMLGGEEKFETVGEKLLKLIGVTPALGTYPLPGGKELTGFLVRGEDAAGREVLLTSQPADKGYQWVMKPGCGVK